MRLRFISLYDNSAAIESEMPKGYGDAHILFYLIGNRYYVYAGFDKFCTLSVIYLEKVCLFTAGAERRDEQNGNNGYCDSQRGKRRKVSIVCRIVI